MNYNSIPTENRNNRGIPNMSSRTQNKTGGSGNLSLPLTAFLLLTVVINSLSIPLLLSASPLIEPICWCICALSVSVLFVFSQKMSSAVFSAILLIFIISSTGTPLLAALVFGGLISISAGAVLMSSATKATVVFPISAPVLIYLMAFSLTSDPIYSLSALAFVPASIALGICTLRDTKKSTSIIWCTAVTLVTVLGGIALVIYLISGELTVTALNRMIDSYKGYYITYVEQAFVQINRTEPTQPMRAEFSKMFDASVNLLPGTVVMICIFFSFVAVSIRNRIFETREMSRFLTPNSREISVSTVTALVFIGAHVLSFTSGPNTSTPLVAIAATNLCMILCPCLIYQAMNAFKALLIKLGLLGLLICGALFACAFFITPSPMLVIALIGAFYTIIVAVDVWAKDHYSKGAP